MSDMVSPHELKNKAFTRVMRGYNPSEVDEHFDFILSAYTDLYKENDECNRRIAKLEAQLAEYSKDSEAIRNALLNAQKVSAKIVDDANEKAEIIVKSVKDSCDAKLEEIRTGIAKECEALRILRKMRREYEEQIRSVIQTQQKTLDDLPDIEQGMEGADAAVREILQNVREQIADMQKTQEPDKEI